jgi:hypothetical protein
VSVRATSINTLALDGTTPHDKALLHVLAQHIKRLGSSMGTYHGRTMAFGIFIHRTDSIYDDIPSERQLLQQIRCEGDHAESLDHTYAPDIA